MVLMIYFTDNQLNNQLYNLEILLPIITLRSKRTLEQVVDFSKAELINHKETIEHKGK